MLWSKLKAKNIFHIKFEVTEGRGQGNFVSNFTISIHKKFDRNWFIYKWTYILNMFIISLKSCKIDGYMYMNHKIKS